MTNRQALLFLTAVAIAGIAWIHVGCAWRVTQAVRAACCVPCPVPCLPGDSCSVLRDGGVTVTCEGRCLLGTEDDLW